MKYNNGYSFANSINALFGETSSKTSENIVETFERIAERFVQDNEVTPDDEDRRETLSLDKQKKSGKKKNN